jgi:hypothetical protein
MSGFEFIFTLFGLLLGLALAEGLGGLARALKSKHRVRIGWPTALLGLFVSCDVVTFWMYGWAIRDLVPVNWPTLFGGFVITAIYFVSASLVFPGDDWDDIDSHFERQYRTVLGGILICNIALLASVITLTGSVGKLDLRTAIIVFSLFPVSLIAIFVRDRRVVIGCLVWLILLYPLSVIWTV